VTTTERDDDTVDLGSVEDVETADALAVRDHARELALDTSPEPSMGRLRRMVEDLKNYKELRKTPYGVLPIGILSAATFVSILDARAFQVAGPTIATELQLNVTQIFSVFAIVGLFSAIAAVGAGYITDRRSRLPWVGIGTIIGGIFGMFSGRANGFGSLATTKVLAEMGGSAAGVPRSSLVADYYPPESRGRVYAINGMMRSLGQVSALVIVGAMVTAWGFRTSFMVTGAAGVIIGTAILVFLREPVRGYMERRALGADEDVARIEEEPASLAESWRTLFGIRTVRRLMISSSIESLGQDMQTLILAFFFAQEYGLNAWELSLAYTPGFFAGIIGATIGGGIVDRYMKRNPSAVLRLASTFIAVAGLALFAYTLRPPLWVIFGVNALISLGNSMSAPSFGVVYANTIPARMRSTGFNIAQLADLPSAVFGAFMGAVVFSEWGFNGVFMLAAVLTLIGALVRITAAGFFELDMRSAIAGTLADEEWRQAKAAGRAKLLVCRDIEVEYSGVKVLFGVDFDVEEGEIVALLGTNGAGKSTLLRAISGTTKASSGAVVFDGRDTTAMPANEVTRKGVVFMPGGRGVFPGMSVRDNLILGAYMIDDQAEADARLDEMFELFPVLRELADLDAGLLSGGQQQQLSLAQAFLCNPRLLLIDELSLGLAPTVVADLLDIVRRIRDTGVTIVVVEQSVNVALSLAERAVFMEKGEVKFVGPTAELLERPDILRAVYVKGSGALTEGTPAAARRRVEQLQAGRPILEVEGLVKRYGGVTAVDDVTFDVREGEVLGLIGPNGAGKTTIFDLVSGYQLPDAGHVRLDGIDITGLSPEERAHRKLVRRFQDARLFPSLTVFETLLVALEQKIEVRSSLLHAFALPQARASERRVRLRAERLLELLELGSYRDKFVKELSTGLRRIVDLACVLAAEPTVLLLDEPSSGIAQAEAESLGPLLRRVRFETGCSILIIEHDMPLISAVSDELVALERGRVITRGIPTDVLNDERVIEAYLGDSDVTVKRSGALS
jgi:ABC-type branched-subunit amino acid transport system ATPase component/predicted MFS family arabinose efflux permease